MKITSNYEFVVSTQDKHRIIPVDAQQYPLATGSKGGIRFYNKFVGILASIFGLTTKIVDKDGHTFYVNKKSLSKWMGEQARGETYEIKNLDVLLQSIKSRNNPPKGNKAGFDMEPDLDEADEAYNAENDFQADDQPLEAPKEEALAAKKSVPKPELKPPKVDISSAEVLQGKSAYEVLKQLRGENLKPEYYLRNEFKKLINLAAYEPPYESENFLIDPKANKTLNVSTIEDILNLALLEERIAGWRFQNNVFTVHSDEVVDEGFVMRTTLAKNLPAAPVPPPATEPAKEAIQPPPPVMEPVQPAATPMTFYAPLPQVKKDVSVADLNALSALTQGKTPFELFDLYCKTQEIGHPAEQKMQDNTTYVMKNVMPGDDKFIANRFTHPKINDQAINLAFYLLLIEGKIYGFSWDGNRFIGYIKKPEDVPYNLIDRSSIANVLRYAK